MDEKLKGLMQELGNAINESLSDSDRIATAIGEIRRAGYDVFLVLEATIGFNRRDDAPAQEPQSRSKRASGREHEHKTRFKWTSQDQKFLKALKIAIDEEAQ
ncbi:MAG TPA: hypothetical protein VN428_13545 [Bryobacteraceae bacterium]|nr:hypothetical protein [Bryobacteraceae bacterium]